MAVPPSISPDVPQNPGLDYAGLLTKGIEILQQLAGEIWTDYNEHDPGVTLLEQLCYALTELSYRAAFPVADLLADEHGDIATKRHALFPAPEIYPCDPLTLNDYRRLLADRVPEVGNVWIQAVDGLYEIEVHVPRDHPCSCDDAISDKSVEEKVLNVYAEHRNLCEDVGRFQVLAPLRARVGAVITIDTTCTPEAVLAALFFNVGLFLAPEIRRQPLSAQRGDAPDVLFEGPLLHSGFIADEELTPRRMQVWIPELEQCLARTGGVLGVRDVSLCVDDAKPVIKGVEAFTVPKDGILVVDALPARDTGFSIQLFRRGAECKLDPSRVKRELGKLWAEQRRRYPLEPQYESRFAVPRGQPRDLARYTSIQRQLPVVYGVGGEGLPGDASAIRRAQARQLKGYLLVFEQLLADFFAQLSHARDLFSADCKLGNTYFHQSAAASVPDSDDVVIEDYLVELERALKDTDPASDRRSRFLDLMLALYADGLDPSTVSGSPDDKAHLNAKTALLHRLVVGTRARGRGFDYQADPSTFHLAGMEIRSRIEIELGLDALEYNARGFYLVEHTLLRFGRDIDGADPAYPPQRERPDFSYAFTVTAVLSRSSGLRRVDASQRLAAEVLRRNAPAHITVKICSLAPPAMAEFEALYGAWQAALREPIGNERSEASARLRRFLEQRTSPG